MKQALVVVSFGTTVEETRSCITAVEDVIRAQVPESVFFRAFTSPTIRRRLAQRGENILSLDEVLNQLSAEGYHDVMVQPTHMLYGMEYDKMKSTADQFAPRFDRFVFGKPMLADMEDLRCLAQHFMNQYSKQDGEALILMGHGTEHAANAVYPAMQTTFLCEGRADIFVATVEGSPTIAEIRAQMNGRYAKAHLVPLMLVAGDHARNDMAGTQEDSWKSQLESDGLIVRCTLRGLGEQPAVQRMYRRHILELL